MVSEVTRDPKSQRRTCCTAKVSPAGRSNACSARAGDHRVLCKCHGERDYADNIAIGLADLVSYKMHIIIRSVAVTCIGCDGKFARENFTVKI